MSDRGYGFAVVYVMFLLPIGAEIGLHGWATGIILAALAVIGVVLFRRLGRG